MNSYAILGTQRIKPHLPMKCLPVGYNRPVPPLINDHLPKHIRNFAAIGGYSLLWPEATAFLRHKGAYSRPEVAIVACGPRPQGFISHNSKPTPVRMDNTRGVKRFEG